MISQMAISRESRRLLNDLETLASQYKTSTIVTVSQAYIADQLTLKYFTAPILNAIKSKVKLLKSRSSKHFTVEHWVSVLDSIFVSNMSVRRENSVVQLIDGNDIGLAGFQVITKYLPVDYSGHDAETIYKIVHEYESNMIANAVRTAKNNNVYNIQYVRAILEKEQALSNIRMHDVEKLQQRAENASEILNREKVQHTFIDMAESQYKWNQQKENAELERKMQELFGGNNG